MESLKYARQQTTALISRYFADLPTPANDADKALDTLVRYLFKDNPNIKPKGNLYGFIAPQTTASPPPTVKKQDRNEIYSSVKLTNVSQPDEVTCQSAVCCMLTGQSADQVQIIRRTLQSFGNPGDPNVMARYLRSQLGDQYRLHTTASLHEVAEWLAAGEAIGTHGWHTNSGHVVLLDGVSIGKDLTPLFSVKDPYGEFDGPNWRFIPGTRFYDGNISALLAYALFVVNAGGMAGSRSAYKKGKFNLSERGLIAHRVLPATQGTLVNLPKPVPSASSSSLVTMEQATKIFGRQPTSSQIEDLNQCLKRFEINTPQRIRHFMAQIAHESGGLKWLEELADGSAYEWRKDIGNTQAGDGKKYKGAGAIQLTGRANYQAFSDYIKDPKVMDGCSYVAAVYPFTSAGFWWMRNKMNALCDRPDVNVEMVTRRVNGGTRGLAERIRYYQIALAIIK